MNFGIQKKRIDPDNLIYKYKNEGKSPKDFRNYQNLIYLFKSLRDFHLNPRGVLKNQRKFKSNLGEIRKVNPRLNKCNTTC